MNRLNLTLLKREPPIQLLTRIDVYNRKGKMTKTTGYVPAHSFTLNFLKHIEYINSKTQSGSGKTFILTDTSGNPITVTQPYGTTYNYNTVNYYMACLALANNDLYGIQVGQGSTAVLYDNYTIESLIPSGYSTNELMYGNTLDGGACIMDDYSCQFCLSRPFFNASGNTVNITEIALTCHSLTGISTTNNNYYLLARDLVGQSIETDHIGVVMYAIRTHV